jgi:excisionase family DNA binding protein
MELVTMAQAAEIMHCTPGAILHHVQKGRIQKHSMGPLYKKRFLVDLEEVIKTMTQSWMERDRDLSNPKLMTTKEMGEYLRITPDAVRHYVHKGYITRHYLPGSDKYYLVDKDEVVAHVKTLEDRYRESLKSPERSQRLREHAKSQPRANGRFVKEDQ